MPRAQSMYQEGTVCITWRSVLVLHISLPGWLEEAAVVGVVASLHSVVGGQRPGFLLGGSRRGVVVGPPSPHLEGDVGLGPLAQGRVHIRVKETARGQSKIHNRY